LLWEKSIVVYILPGHSGCFPPVNSQEIGYCCLSHRSDSKVYSESPLESPHSAFEGSRSFSRMVWTNIWRHFSSLCSHTRKPCLTPWCHVLPLWASFHLAARSQELNQHRTTSWALEDSSGR